MFKEQYDEKLRDSEQMSKFSPPINKVGKLLRPSIIPIIGQTKSLNSLDMMNTRKIVVCRFSKGRLGEEIAQILAFGHKNLCSSGNADFAYRVVTVWNELLHGPQYAPIDIHHESFSQSDSHAIKRTYATTTVIPQWRKAAILFAIAPYGGDNDQ